MIQQLGIEISVSVMGVVRRHVTWLFSQTHKYLLKHFLHKYSNSSFVVAFMKIAAILFRMGSSKSLILKVACYDFNIAECHICA